MLYTITFTKSYSTDDSDPIIQQSDDRIAEWFVGIPAVQALMAEGFGLEVTAEGGE